MEELFDAMRAELYDGKFCHSDFAIDIEHIKKHPNATFIWMVRQDATYLTNIDDIFANMITNECIRLSFFRSKAEYYIPYGYQGRQKTFYISGNKLIKLEWEEWIKFRNNMIVLLESFRHALIRMYPEDYKLCDKPIAVHLKCDRSYLKACLKHADKLQDKSLKECLHRLRHSKRAYKDVVLNIYKDFAPNSLYFEILYKKSGDSEYTLDYNGGIIYSEKPDSHGNHWSTHT